MMRKRILISALLLLFLVSTTGLPITINYCKMAASEEMSMCSMHHKPVKSLCCAENTVDNFSGIYFNKPDCCQTEFVYNKVSDEFVTNKTDVQFFTSLQNSIHSNNIIPIVIEIPRSLTHYCDSSPPFLINPELHISNSVILI